MTYFEKFEYLKNKYASKADKSLFSGDFAAQITLTDEDCNGIFYIAYMNSVFACEPYDYHDNTVNVTIDSRLLEKILDGEADAQEEYLNGHFKANGNLTHALEMINALKSQNNSEEKPEETAAPVKKAVKKKPAAKAETEKKPAAKKTTTKPAAKKSAAVKKAAKESK